MDPRDRPGDGLLSDVSARRRRRVDDVDVGRHVGAPLEVEGEPERRVDLEWRGELGEHDVGRAGFQRHVLAGRELERSDRFHRHHPVLVDRAMDHGPGGDVRCDTDTDEAIVAP